MNGTQAMAQELCGALVDAEGEFHTIGVVLYPPATLLAQVSKQVEHTVIQTGAQDIDVHVSGAHTGQISGPMITDAGGKYTIVGHSERRTEQGETDDIVAAKVSAAVEFGLTPILCLGETQTEREAEITEYIIERQLEAVIDHCGIDTLALAIIAYEPVWAIGTGLTASPQQAQMVHAFIREQIRQHDSAVANKIHILYGGSMKPDNAAHLLDEPDIDGGLIGGASLKAEDFIAICRAAAKAAPQGSDT